MENEKAEAQILLPHHEQQELCTTRLPYRQGRRLTAVKVYSITKESNHLLVFGVPSLKLRQEAKALFQKFGKLLQFNISKEHAAEAFTETYHACYERIQSARVAKKMLDTKNFYGGSLHVCYAPEMETLEETQQKLIQRQKDVLFRLRNLQNEKLKAETDTQPKTNSVEVVDETVDCDRRLLNMGEINVINRGGEHKKHKQKIKKDWVAGKRFKPCFVDNQIVNNEVVNNDRFIVENNVTLNNDVENNKRFMNNDKLTVNNEGIVNNEVLSNKRSVVNDKLSVNKEVTSNGHHKGNDRDKSASSNVKSLVTDVTELEVVDCTSVDKITISNINEALNYNKFGDEAVFKMPAKPVNKIKFNLNKRSLIYPMFYFLTLVSLWVHCRLKI